MSEKLVYAWACRGSDGDKYDIYMKKLNIRWVQNYPLYSIEEVQHVIENNELPKRPVAWVYWDNYANTTDYKSVLLREPSELCDNRVPVYSADELLAELQKEI